MTRPRRGPRPEVDTRAAIIVAAREEFSANGFDGAAVRAVARGAGVDPALVRHYFASKESLFAAALELPVDPAALVARVVEGGPDGIGERLLRAFCEVWDPPAHRERLGHLVPQVAVVGGAADPVRAASLAVSQLAGLALLRYVVELEPVASASHDEPA